MAVLMVGVCGCKTLGFYAQAIHGQYQILATQKPISRLVEDPSTPTSLKARFELLQALRIFAEKELLLPVDGHYLKYADLKRPFVVWNVEAAPEFSLEPKGWWYPFVGKLEYRGYFKEAEARKYAEWLKNRGYEVQVSGIAAYSTLGWFRDPVLNTFVFDPEPLFVETIFHELAHQRLFAAGDKDFNEAYATSVAREGVRRWLQLHGNPVALSSYETSLAQEDAFAALVAKTRARLECLYGDKRGEDGKVRAGKFSPRALTAAQMRVEKQGVFKEMRSQYRDMSGSWDKASSRDWWFSKSLDNAKLNSVAAYYDLVPAFEELLRRCHGQWGHFHREAERLADMDKKKRHVWLSELLQARQSGGTTSCGESPVH